MLMRFLLAFNKEQRFVRCIFIAIVTLGTYTASSKIIVHATMRESMRRAPVDMRVVGLPCIGRLCTTAVTGIPDNYQYTAGTVYGDLGQRTCAMCQ